MKTNPLLTLAASLTLSAPLPAALTYLDLSTLRADANSEQHEWDIFTSGHTTANTADVVSDGSATLTQSNTGGLVTGGGNIYSWSTPLSFTIEDAPTGVSASSPYVGNVVLQLKTAGSTIDASSILLTYENASGGSGTATLFGRDSNITTTTIVVPGGGTSTSYEGLWAFQWDLSGLSVTEFDITFEAPAHTSLDQVSLDTVTTGSSFSAFTTPIPEPGSALLLASFASLLALRRNR